MGGEEDLAERASVPEQARVVHGGESAAGKARHEARRVGKVLGLERVGSPPPGTP